MKAKYWLLGALGLVLSLGTSGCGESEPVTPAAKFDFTISLEKAGASRTLIVGEDDKIIINAINAPEGVTYTFEVPDASKQYIRVDEDGTIHPDKATPEGASAYVTITANGASLRPKRIGFTVTDEVEPANGGKNWSSNPKAREEILAELEHYAMDNFLTGITLFESAGYVRYSNRIKVLPSEYITGYGFGVLTEGTLDKTKKLATEDKFPAYYHVGTSSDPETVNGFDAQGSDVSDLFGYITSSFWGTKMNAKMNGYEWYPVLARDSLDGEHVYDRPMHLEEDNELNLYRKWRVHVKTGKESEGGIKYRYSGTLKDSKGKSFDGRPVELKDYETTLMAMLTKKSGVFRGGELAADTTYGIRGALTYYNSTPTISTDANCIKSWNEMIENNSLGIKTGEDEHGSYIDFELLTPIDPFTAMYTLSSNLYSPIPLEFLQKVGDGSFTSGIKNFGTFKGSIKDSAILDNTIAIGPYFLEFWNKNSEMVFGRNDEWYEVETETRKTGRYKIEGVHMRYFENAASDPEFIYNQFLAGQVDVTSIPATKMDEREGDDKPTKGDATFKLNVNSCSQERWNELFGTNGTIDNKGVAKVDNHYTVKPWMSNKNFLKGLYWSIDRKDFAQVQGVTPSYCYFADSYMSDPEKGISYNDTKLHEKAVSDFHNYIYDSQGHIIDDDYGYSLDAAHKYFKAAVNELAAATQIELGTKDKPTEIHISIGWMYQSDIKQYGNKIARYFTEAFNDDSVCGGRVKLVISDAPYGDHEPDQFAVTKWDDIYSKYLQIGEYDLAFGAISGNAYNPLNFMEVLKSDNSSGFTLNWGADTSKVSEHDPIIYDGKAWSFDALWAAADHGTVVEEGRARNPVKHNYLQNPRSTSTGDITNNIYLGAQFEVTLEFVTVPDVEVAPVEIHIWLLGVGSFVIDDADIKKVGNGLYTITFTLTPEVAGNYDTQIYNNNELSQKVEENPALEHPLTLDFYNEYWNFEVYYNFKIKGDSPSQVLDNVSKNQGEDAKTRR